VRIARYETIANLIAESATADADATRALVGCDDWSTPAAAAACAARFIETTGRRIFRRPLTPIEHERFARRFTTWAASLDFDGAVRLTLSSLLQSPQFLYLAEPPPPAGSATGPAKVIPVEPYAMASRLSFLLWESGPDDGLLEAAAHDELQTVAQLRAQGQRMLRDGRARRLYWSFHRQWLGLDRIAGEEHLVRTPEIDARWTAASQLSAFEESRLFVENTLANGGSFRDLLTSRRAWVNGEMARLYGVAAPADPATYVETTLPEGERAGLLTRVAFLAAHSHRGATSPPIRGNALQLRLLCQSPLPPPPNVDLSPPVAEPGSGPQTNRVLFEKRTSPAACQSCHVGLNGFGFGLEHYTASGAYQAADHGLPVDATGDIVRTDVDRPYDGAIELSQALSDSRDVHACATEEWVRYALGRAPVDAEQPMLEALTDSFMASGGDVGTLLLELVTQPTFRMRLVGGAK
jgi:hypothetical protein